MMRVDMFAGASVTPSGAHSCQQEAFSPRSHLAVYRSSSRERILPVSTLSS